MDSRGRKRKGAAGLLPADKRVCSSSEFRSSPPPSHPLPPSSESEYVYGDDFDEEEEEDDDEDSAEEVEIVEYEYKYDVPDCFKEENIKRDIETWFDGALAGLASDETDVVIAAVSKFIDTLRALEPDLIYTVYMFYHTVPKLDSIVQALVDAVGGDGSAELLLESARAVFYLCRMIPGSVPVLQRHGGLPVLCRRLLAPEYLVVGEQCVQVLEKVSRSEPVPCLEAGAVMACLTYIDFFPTEVQKMAISTVANMCKTLSPSHAPHVVDAVPILSRILQYDNDKLVEIAASCLRMIVESFSDLPEKLEQILCVDLISQCVNLIASKHCKSLGRAFTNDILTVLSLFASHSPEVVKMLLGLNIGATLSDVLTSQVSSGIGTTRSLLTSGHYDQALEVFKWLHQLLPPVTICDEKNQQSLAKEQIVLDNHLLLHQFAQNIIPLLIQVVDSVTSSLIRYTCLSVIKSVIYFSTPEELLELLNKICISSSLANLLSDKDDHVLVSALQIADILLQKFPDMFLKQFVKLGVAYAIDLLLKLDDACDMVDQPLDIGSSSFSNSQIAETSVSECICYSFDLSRLPPPQTRRCNSGRATLFDLAKNIKCSYFAPPRDDNINPDQALSMPKTLCSVLNGKVNKSSEIDYDAENEEYLAHVLDRILFETKMEDMSTFEFIEIGIVKSIINYLCDGQYFQREMLCPDFQCRGHVVMQRFQTFARMMSSKYCSKREDLMLTVFIRKLQSSLISLCNLPAILSQPFKSIDGVYADIPYVCTTLHPCFNVKFAKDKADNVLGDCSARVLRVEPSSSFSAIEKYLWPNIAPNKTATGLVGKGMSELVDDLNLSQLMANEGTVPESRSFKCLESSVKQETPISLTEKFSELRPCKVGKFTDPQKETSSEAKMSFYLYGKEIDKSLTIYQAIIQKKGNLQSDLVLNNMFWNRVYTITYKTTDSRDIHPPTHAAENGSLSFWVKLPFFSSLLSAELPFQLKRENPFYDILFLLRTLEGVNKYAFMLLSNEGLHDFSDQLKGTLLIPESELLSSKFSEKLEQQMTDNFSSLTGNMRAWFSCLVALCPFLFSFNVRSTFFRVAQLAFPRTNQIQMTNQEDYNIDSLRVPWSVLYGGKFGVDRNHILESAKKIMELNAHIKDTLAVEYADEIGTGIGPTMEFYTLASREFQKRGLNLWRGDHYPSTLPVCPTTTGERIDVKYVDAPMGLFPRPWSTIVDFFNENQFSEVILNFKLLGWLVARALYDKRILDLHFSKAFYKLILGQELGICDISSFDPELGRTLLEFQSLAHRKRYLEENSSGNCEAHFRDARIEDLYIDFTLPGYADYVLFTDEDSKLVSSSNLEEYIFLVVDATVRSGILRQMEAFECGFNEVFPMRNLCIFSEEELEQMLCGEHDTWTFEELLDNIKFDHGYTVRSPQVLYFLEIILEFKCHERRAFLQFVTGAPRLPHGGLAALTPKLTVVRKHVSGCADMGLPSVMTCANYLKLPPYSSKEKMRERTLYAITEGQGSFHLS